MSSVKDKLSDKPHYRRTFHKLGAGGAVVSLPQIWEMPAIAHPLNGASYPIRTFKGIGCWQDTQMILRTYWRDGRLKKENVVSMNESAAAVFHVCDGIYNVRELVQLMHEAYPEQPASDLADAIHHCLIFLADRGLVALNLSKSEPIPIIRAQFQGFWPGFDLQKNYFLRLMARHMCVFVTRGKEADVVFRYASDSDLSERSIETIDRRMTALKKRGCYTVGVSDGRTTPDFDQFDYVFSPMEVASEFADRHGQLPFDCYFHSEKHRVDRTIARRFYDFLFPVDNIGELMPAFDYDEPRKAFSKPHSSERFHVCLCTDRKQSAGFFALINSIIRNTEKPERFRFHIMVDRDPDYYRGVLVKHFGNQCHFEIEPFRNTKRHRTRVEFLKTHMRVEGGSLDVTRINKLMNFARVYLPDIFPQIDLGLYLDVDMIAQADLSDVFATDLSNAVVASPLNRTLDSWKYHTGLKVCGPGFNAGFMLIDFHQWRKSEVTRSLEKIIELHKQRKLFAGGTQSLLNLVLYKQVRDIDPMWNLGGLGKKPHIELSQLESARMLHWSGIHKPWLEHGLYTEFWEKYRL